MYAIYTQTENVVTRPMRERYSRRPASSLPRRNEGKAQENVKCQMCNDKSHAEITYAVYTD